MRRLIIISSILMVVLALFCVPALATITQSGADPADDSTTHWVGDPAWDIVLTSDNQTTFNGTITSVMTDDLTTITDGVNGTHTLTFADGLDELTTYQVWVNVTDGKGDYQEWVNTSYNFTTQTARLRHSNQNLDAQQILLVIFLGIVVCLVFLVEAMRIMNGSIKDYKELVSAVVMVMILVVIMSFI